MTVTESEARNPPDFYGGQYGRFGSALAAEVRREGYGADLGQQGWRSLDEQAQIAELVGEHQPCHILDVACGSGGPSLAIAGATGSRLTGIDIEAAAIEEARQRSVALRLADRAEFIVGDCSQPLPFDEQAFDVVVCIDAVLHFRDRFAVFADWFRLLKPGGRLLLTDAAVITGPVSQDELNVRASQAHSVFVPPGVNEKGIAEAGFRLRGVEDTTPALAEVAERLFTARSARATALQEEEGADWFDRRQAFLSLVASLAAGGRLSRFRYVAAKQM